VLELEMPPSGCLAPGASATLKVTFKPLVRVFAAVAQNVYCDHVWLLGPASVLLLQCRCLPADTTRCLLHSLCAPCVYLRAG
jgi:hypothetical protein